MVLRCYLAGFPDRSWSVCAHFPGQARIGIGAPASPSAFSAGFWASFVGGGRWDRALLPQLRSVSLFILGLFRPQVRRFTFSAFLGRLSKVICERAWHVVDFRWGKKQILEHILALG